MAAVFLFTYAGMALRRVPGLRVDRTGIALIADGDAYEVEIVDYH